MKFNKIVAKLVKFTLKKIKFQQFPNLFVKKWWNFSIKKKKLYWIMLLSILFKVNFLISSRK